jgi:hypothetical protein
MRHLEFSYYDNETGENFDYSTDIEDDTIAGVLNATVGMLRLIGYSDNLIADMIGETYFNRDMFGDLDAATDEAINEYIASRDASDNRLDDLSDYPEM